MVETTLKVTRGVTGELLKNLRQLEGREVRATVLSNANQNGDLARIRLFGTLLTARVDGGALSKGPLYLRVVSFDQKTLRLQVLESRFSTHLGLAPRAAAPNEAATAGVLNRLVSSLTVEQFSYFVRLFADEPFAATLRDEPKSHSRGETLSTQEESNAGDRDQREEGDPSGHKHGRAPSQGYYGEAENEENPDDNAESEIMRIGFALAAAERSFLLDIGFCRLLFLWSARPTTSSAVEKGAIHAGELRLVLYSIDPAHDQRVERVAAGLQSEALFAQTLYIPAAAGAALAGVRSAAEILSAGGGGVDFTA